MLVVRYFSANPRTVIIEGTNLCFGNQTLFLRARAGEGFIVSRTTKQQSFIMLTDVK